MLKVSSPTAKFLEHWKIHNFSLWKDIKDCEYLWIDPLNEKILARKNMPDFTKMKPTNQLP